MSAQIELRHVSYSYGRGIPALRDISLTVQEGECIALSGDNGSGKSTLFKLLNGLVFPQEGEYLFDGIPVSEKTLKDRRFEQRFHQKMGYVFQDSDRQLFCASVWEETAFGPSQMGLPPEEVRRRVSDSLRLLGIEELAQRAPWQLSGGEKKKTAFACVLSMNPDVLMTDEPMAGLDRKSRQRVLSVLLAWKARGRTLLFSTHEEDALSSCADRHLLLGEDHRLTEIQE